MLTMSEIRFEREGKTILDGVAFHVPRGEAYALAGSNGAGKSSVFRLFYGLERPTSGKALVNGTDVSENEYAVKATIGYAPEDTYIPGYLTPRQYLEFCGRMRGLTSKTARERCDLLLGLFFLRDAADTIQIKLSKGERRKVVVASAFVHDPDCVLLDEPTEGLDPESIDKLIRHVRSWRKDRSKTLLLATHRLSFAATLCDRVGFVVHGRLAREIALNSMGETSLEEAYFETAGQTNNVENDV